MASQVPTSSSTSPQGKSFSSPPPEEFAQISLVCYWRKNTSGPYKARSCVGQLFFSLLVTPNQLGVFLLTLFSKHFHFRTTNLNFKPELVFSSLAVPWASSVLLEVGENILVVSDNTLALISSQHLLMTTIRQDLGLGGLSFWPSVVNLVFSSTPSASCLVVAVTFLGQTPCWRHSPAWHNLDDPEWGFLAWGPYKWSLWNANRQKLRPRMPCKTWSSNPQTNLYVKRERRKG